MVLTYLVEFTDEAVNGLALRLELLNRQSHRQKVFQDVVEERRDVLINLEWRSFG
jgi:hypothetical protein